MSPETGFQVEHLAVVIKEAPTSVFVEERVVTVGEREQQRVRYKFLDKKDLKIGRCETLIPAATGDNGNPTTVRDRTPSSRQLLTRDDH